MSYVFSRQLLARAHAELDGAQSAPEPREQFLHAHMAALRAAAAVVSVVPRDRAPRRRGTPRSVWVQLEEAGPQWQEWARYYTASAHTRAALESGQLREIESAQAQEAIDTAGRFIQGVGRFLDEQAAMPMARAS